jgi:hypothetical protein
MQLLVGGGTQLAGMAGVGQNTMGAFAPQGMSRRRIQVQLLGEVLVQAHRLVELQVY